VIKQRADERTRTADLLITSDASGVAGVCRRLQIPHIWTAFSALGCCVLHRIAFPVVSEWYQKYANFTSQFVCQASRNLHASHPSALYNERSFFTFTVPGVRGDAPSLDRYSYWIPSMGRDAAEEMDEALV
jgi:hypothetical protein